MRYIAEAIKTLKEDDNVIDFERQYFGSWKIKEELGAGSFGSVYVIERKDFGYTYRSAMKVISIPQDVSAVRQLRNEGVDELSIDKYFVGLVNELVSEFALMSQLKGNSNIVSYEDHEVIEKENHRRDICIRMELLTSLDDYIQSKPLMQSDVVRLGLDLCNALMLCQRHNIIHRDIKPENIFVSENGDFKLGDFGIARTAEKTTYGLSQKGTYTYMAPEVYKGEAYGPSVDIYSLGLVMYRLLNYNRTPFLPSYPNPIAHSDREAAMTARLSGAQMPMPANASPRLARMILKACAYDPAVRYDSPQSFHSDLMKLQDEELNNEIQTVLEKSLETSAATASKTVYLFHSPKAENAGAFAQGQNECRANSQGPETPKGKICKKCGTLCMSETKFCEKCGARLESNVDSGRRPKAHPSNPTPESQGRHRTTVSNRNKKGRSHLRTSIVYSALVVLVLCGLGFGGYQIYRYQKMKAREAFIQESLAQAQNFADSQDFENAISVLKKVSARYGDIDEILNIVAEYRYRQLNAQIMECVENGNYDDALLLIENELSDDTSGELGTLKDELIRQQYQLFTNQINVLMTEEKYDEALLLIEQAMSNNHYSDLGELKANIVQKKQQLLTDSIQTLVQAQKYDEALLLLDASVDSLSAEEAETLRSDIVIEKAIITAEAQFNEGNNYADAIKTINLAISEVGEIPQLIGELQKYHEYIPVALDVNNYTQVAKYISVGVYDYLAIDVNENAYDANNVIAPYAGTLASQRAESEDDAYVSYYLNCKYTLLTGVIYRPYKTLSCPDEWSENTVAKIYGDGVLLYEAPNITQNTFDPIQFSVDVTGVRELKIVLLGVWSQPGSHIGQHDRSPKLCMTNLVLSK